MVTVTRYIGWLAGPLIAIPAVFLHSEQEPPASHDGTVTMGHEEFNVKSVTVHQGQLLTLRNDSRWLHVLVHGKGAVVTPEPGSPSLGHDEMAVVQRGDVVQFGPWQHLGVFHVTCQLHPEMTVTVHVVA